LSLDRNTNQATAQGAALEAYWVFALQLAITASVLDKCLIYVGVMPRYIWDFDTRFALYALAGA
jgi:hypothetical protein